MYLQLSFLIFVLVIAGSQSTEITPYQILDRITALEEKDSQLTEFNTRLLVMVENQREQLKQKDITIGQLLKRVDILEETQIDNQNLKAEVRDIQARITALENKAVRWTDTTINQEGNGQEGGKTQLHSPDLHKGTSTQSGVLDDNKHLLQTSPKDSHLAELKHIQHDQDKAKRKIHPSRKIRQTSSAPELVAFHAVNNLGQVSHIGVNQNIVFETVLLNLASGYHAQHGIFIAPTNGLYLFSTSIMADSNGKAVYANLVKNGAVLARVQGQGHSGYDQGSVTVVTQLNASDEVWVRLYCCADDTLYGGQYTSFTGVMLTAL